MAKVNIQPKDTIEAEIRECLRLNGDGTTVEFASKEEVERETEALLGSDKELLKRLAD